MTQDDFDDLRDRLKRIEEFLFPPDPPGSPTIFDQIRDIEDRLTDLRGEVVTRDEADRMWDEINAMKDSRVRPVTREEFAMLRADLAALKADVASLRLAASSRHGSGAMTSEV